MDLFWTTREIILDTVIDEYDFCSVPKIALEDNEQKLSVMLMADMKSVDVNTFTRTLGKKNDGFKGSLRLVRSKFFTANDKTRNGQSMNGVIEWTLNFSTFFSYSICVRPTGLSFVLAIPISVLSLSHTQYRN